MTARAKFGILLLVVAATSLTLFGVMSNRPSTLSVEIRSHPGAAAIMQAKVNGGSILDGTFRGRSQTGGLAYQSRFGAALNVELAWYDLLEDRSYQKTFELDARDLSTFGDEDTHASIRVEIGPGADITVTTPEPEGLRLVGLNRMDEITPEMDIPVEVLHLCADPLANDTEIVAYLKEAMADETGLARVMSQREAWLAENAAPQPRCPEVQP